MNALPSPRTGAEPSARPLILYAVLLYATFAPTFRPLLGTAGAIIVNGGLLILMSLALGLNRFTVRFVDRREATAVGIMAAALLYYLLAVCLGSLFLSRVVIFRDLFELHKPFLHLLSLLLPLILFRQLEDLKHLERALGVAFTGIILLAAIQYTGIAPVGDLYTKPANVQMGRVTVPFWNPYDFGFGVSFFFYYYLLRHLRDPRLATVVLPAVGLLAIVLSQSRTMVATVAMALVALVPLALVLERQRSLRRGRIPLVFLRYSAYGLAIAVLGVWAYMAVAEEFAYLIYGFERLILEGEQSSLNIRINQMAATIEAARRNPMIALFGNGVSKGTEQMVESGYAFFLFRFGLVGFVVIFLTPLLFMLGLMARTLIRGPANDLIGATFIWCASVFVASIGNNFTEQFRISFYYYFLLGTAIRHYALIRRPVTPTAPDEPRPNRLVRSHA